VPLDVPFRLGPFVVDARGRPEPSEPGQFPSFRLAWRGCPVAMRASAADLLTRITCFLPDLAPYLDVLGEADVPVESVGPPLLSNGGTEKT
jgi:hypothetical protein